MAVNELNTYAEALVGEAEAADETTSRAPGADSTFRALFDRYADSVFNFIYRMVGRRDVAEELTQETFLRVHRKLPGLHLRPDVKLSTWIFAVAKNVSRESLRSRGKDAEEVELADDSVRALRDKDLQPDELLLGRELDTIIQDALRTLEADKRMVFTLRVIQQLSYDEIVAITGFSLPKVKADIFRARGEMRRLLRPYLEAGHEM